MNKLLFGKLLVVLWPLPYATGSKLLACRIQSIIQEILYFSCHLVAAADAAPHPYLHIRKTIYFCDAEQVYISVQVQ